jgi:cytochrome b6-f complex iron-sulfur subunit
MILEMVLVGWSFIMLVAGTYALISGRFSFLGPVLTGRKARLTGLLMVLPSLLSIAAIVSVVDAVQQGMQASVADMLLYIVILVVVLTGTLAVPIYALRAAEEPSSMPPDESGGHAASISLKKIGQETNLLRRNVVKYLLGFSVIATACGVLTPVIGYLWPPSRQLGGKGSQVRVASLTELQAVGGMVVPAQGKPIVLTYSQQSQVKAFSAICTHLGCVVRWQSAAGYIECPCHDGRFNSQTGSVISGPPPGPLPPREVVIDGDDIYVAM